jgi:hypothetical protein
MISGSHSGSYKKFYLLGYNTMWPVENQPTFRRNVSSCHLLHAGFLLGLLFDPEVREDMLL